MMAITLKESLDQLTGIIEDYHGTIDPNGDQLNNWIKDVSALLFFLSTERIKAHKSYNAIMFNRGTNSVSAQAVTANEQAPELYKLRYIIKAGYEVLGAMRSNLVSRRQERDNTN